MKRVVKQAQKIVDTKIAQRLEVICIVSFAAILVLLPAHAFVSTWGGTEIGPLLVWKSWKEILLTLLIPVVVAYCFARPAVAKQLWARSFNKLIVFYVALHLVLTVFSQASTEAVIAGLLMNIRFLMMFVLAQIIVASNHRWVSALKVQLPRWLLWVGLVLSLLAILQVTVAPKDFLTMFGYDKDATIAPYTLVDDNPEVLRAFATMRGPNTLGAYLLIPLAFALYFVLRRRWLWLSGASLALGVVALILTGSRSAWIGFAVMAAVLAILLVPAPTVKKWVKLASAPLLIVGGVFLWVAINVPAVRLAVFHSSPNDPYLLEGSSEKHWLATLDGIKGVVANPLGTGPGSAGPASFYSDSHPALSENYFVQIAQEVGIAGLLLFLVINILVAANLFRQHGATPRLLLASFAGLSIICLFLHGWADDPTAMTWWGLAGLYVATGVRHNKERQ